MSSRHYLEISDYIVITLSLLVSVGIGIASKFHGVKDESHGARDYLLAGRKMSKIPVIFSIIVTLISPTVMIGIPSESYRYGYKSGIGFLSFPVGMLMAAWIFLPVYFQCGVSTVNEFLEMRYGRMIRRIMSGMILIQMMFYMCTALFGAVLSLSAVTNLSLEISIVSLGIVCAVYCSFGGLKAVLWTDMFQAILMLICMISIYVAGIMESGGVSQVYKRSKEGGRLVFFDFDLDMTKRYTFWSVILRSFMFGIAAHGTNQMEIQRLLSTSNIKKSQSTLQLTILPSFLSYLSCSLLGLIIFSVYYQCDPILNKEHTGISKYDQIVPYFIVEKFKSIPGMTGLCIAGIFSASLSTISSALNSASTVTVIDFIKPFYNLSDKKIVWLAKLFCLIYSGACIGLSFLFLDMKSLVQLGSSLVAALEGPMLAIFLVGVLSRKACDKCASFALILGYSISVWIGFSALFSGYYEKPLPLNINSCPKNSSNIFLFVPVSDTSTVCGSNANCTISSSTSHLPKTDVFILYRISYLWHGPISFFCTMFLIFFAVLITGWNRNVIPEDSKCLSPVTHFWRKKNTASNIHSLDQIKQKD